MVHPYTFPFPQKKYPHWKIGRKVHNISFNLIFIDVKEFYCTFVAVHTISTSMPMPLAMDLSMLTLAVVALTVAPLHNARGAYTMPTMPPIAIC